MNTWLEFFFAIITRGGHIYREWTETHIGDRFDPDKEEYSYSREVEVMREEITNADDLLFNLPIDYKYKGIKIRVVTGAGDTYTIRLTGKLLQGWMKQRDDTTQERVKYYDYVRVSDGGHDSWKNHRLSQHRG